MRRFITIKIFLFFLVSMTPSLCIYGQENESGVLSVFWVKGGDVDSTKINHEAVDLGLSVKWASCNVGASSPEEFGAYYAWGEKFLICKNKYDWKDYWWCKGTNRTLNKYCTSEEFGVVDNKLSLELDDDIAHSEWKGNWRLPTVNEVKELKDKCTFYWTDLNGVIGIKVTGKNGNSIFLPAAGYKNDSQCSREGVIGRYWTSSLYEKYPSGAYYLYFDTDGLEYGTLSRHLGFTIRPVCGNE